MEHIGATEDYADVLAEIREMDDQFAAASGHHIDGSLCRFEAMVIWRCTECAREQSQEV